MKPNQRPIVVVGLLAALIALVAAGSIYPLVAGEIWWGVALAGGICGLALACVALSLLAARSPRLVYHDGELLVYSRSFTPQRVPIDVVEVLFLGSGPALPVGKGNQQQEQQGPRAANVVVRLAESATDWHNRELASAIDKWSDGYIVLSGTWCEPISHEGLNAINRRLAEVRRQRRDSQTEAAKATS